MFSKDTLGKYKSNIANLAVIIIFVVISINIYKSQTKNTASLNERKDTETKKNKVLEEIGQLQKNIDDLTNLVNSKDISATINNLNNMAREFSVKISAIKPAGIQDFPLYTKYPFELTVEADNYHQIGKFISKIETNPNIYTVESLSMHPQADNQLGEVTASLKISTVLFKVK